jgi:D-alanyl-D-alanine carboxypeptidase/D-alanyl-D-alanine-endopeptidase (penicillin-binding protein 4)
MRSRSNRVVGVLLVALGFAACHASPRLTTAQASRSQTPVGRLQHDFDAALAAPSLERGYWSVLAKSLRTDETLYSLNPDKLMMPASTMKVLTLAAAAERLGWDFTYETRLVGTGRIDAGTLDGDLLVVGDGDPTIVDRDGMAARLFENWAEQLKAAGVRTIAGSIVGDDSAFDRDALGYGWSWDDLVEGYAAGVSALQFNENRVQVTIAPGPTIGAPADVSITPDGSDLIVVSDVTTSAGKPGSIEIHRQPGTPRLEVRGAIPLGAEPNVRSASVEHVSLFFATSLRAALIAHGVEVRGPAVGLDDLRGAAPRTKGATLVTYRSPPLSAMMLQPFKFSLNMHEETLLKTMGAAAGTPTFKAGRAAVRSTLERWGVPAGAFIQADGSGLSRYNYLTSDALVRTLAHVARDDKLRGAFELSLPIAGRDGTLAGRMRDTPAEGNVHAKTGAMTGVRALAGYVSTADGEPVVFAVIANNFEAPAETIVRTIDQLVVRLAEFSRR